MTTTGMQLGPYLLRKRLGTGGMASVWTAVDGAGHALVIKRILPSLAAEAEFVAMFEREATLSARMRHENIVRVLDHGDYEGERYLAMEQLHGRDLSTVMMERAARGAPAPGLGAYVGLGVCRALAYVHELAGDDGAPLHLIHRDVSLSNVMLGFDGGVKLLDFGVAKAMADQRTQRTQAGVLKGKWAYLAPEQVEGGAVDQRADVFALGIVLWEMLTGRRLFKAPSGLQTLERVRAGVGAGAVDDQPGGAGGARRDRDEGAGQGAARSLAVGGGIGGGARARGGDARLRAQRARGGDGVAVRRGGARVSRRAAAHAAAWGRAARRRARARARARYGADAAHRRRDAGGAARARAAAPHDVAPPPGRGGAGVAGRGVAMSAVVMAAYTPSPPARVGLVVPGILTERPRVLRFVAGACRAQALAADIEEALVSAVGEAFNHAVLDSYAAVEGTVAVELDIAGGRVTVTLRDRGAGPHAAVAGARRIERRYGLFIMMRAMDEVRWWREGDENVVAMVKRLPRA